jgi:hypothetical protein
MIIVYILVGLIVLLLLVAAAVGTKWKFEKSILIQASMDKVWPHINTFKASNEWSPWIGQDPNIRQQITGVDGTPGATYSWESNEKNVGAGSQTMQSITEQSEVVSQINFLRPIKGKADGYIRIAPEGGGTRAVWGITSATPYPMNIIKLFGVIEKNLDRDFTKGLSKLKELSEK